VLALGAVPASADHKPKPKHHHKSKAKKKKPKAPALPPGVSRAGTPVTITLLEGSTATLDLGDGQAPRTVPLSGGAAGLILGGYRLNRDNVVRIQAATVKLGAAPVLTDGCPTPVAAVDPISVLRIDPLKYNNVTIGKDGNVTAAVAAVLRLVLDTRAGGCPGTVSSTGYATTALIVRPAGTVVPGLGLTTLTLDSPPQWLQVGGCLTAGSPTLACATAPVPVAATLRTHLVVTMKVG
jgi:hypothetical protein